ncbi:MAG: flagellar hook-basal body complex protein FliE [Pseudomonadota bacterium]
MEISGSLAGRFYETIQGALKPGAPTPAPQESAGASFSDTAQRAAASFVETLRQGEETAKAGMVGRADPQSVVTALASAEIAVQTAMSVRDKVVESYQEILRMPV